MALIPGKDLKFFIYRDGLPVAICHARECTFSTNTEELECTGPSSGRDREYLPGMNDTTIDSPGVVVYSHSMNLVQLQEFQKSGVIFEFKISLYESGGLQYKGNAFITNTTGTAANKDVHTFGCTMRVTGPLEIIKQPIIKNVYLASMDGQRLIGCPNPYPVGVLWYDGTFIGPAHDEGQVIAVFNDYAATQGGYLSLSSGDGCDFVMSIAWNSPLNPDWVVAIPGDGFVLAGGAPDDVIGQNDIDNNVIGV